MAATQSEAIVSPHSDLITSLLFSPQSTHLATGSLDSHIRIARKNLTTGSYDSEPVTFKAHDGPVLCLSWSKPHFGLILASGGIDGTIKVWRQPDQSHLLPRQSHPHHHHNKSSIAGGGGGGTTISNSNTSIRHSNQTWILCATLTEPRGTIRSLGFSPSEFGLKLAAVSSDSRLRVWECLDPIKANDFTLLHEIDLNQLPLQPTGSSSTSGSSTINNSSAVSAGGGGGSSNISSGFSNASGSTSTGGNLDNGSSSVSGGNSSSVTGSSVDGRRIGQSGGTVESDGGWSLCWCREHWWGERLAVSSGTNGIIRLFHFSPHSSSWSNFLNLYPTRQTLSSLTPESNAPPPLHLPPTSSLNWAPPSGRSFQLLASGSKDSKVRVYKIFPPSLQGPGSSQLHSHSNSNHGTGHSGSGNMTSLQEGGSVGGEWTAQLDVELDESIHRKPAASNPSSSSIIHGTGVFVGSAGVGSNSSTATTGNTTTGGTAASAGFPGSGSGGVGSTQVEWNVTGTVLSTSGGEDGAVRLWKSTYTGQWRQITSLKTEVSSGLGGGSGGDMMDH